MTSLAKTGLFLGLLALTSSCAAQDSDAINSRFSLTVTPGEAEGLLAFVNDCASSFEVFDEDAGLDARAARNIVAQRDGLDEICGSADDTPLLSIEALDAVSWVGDVALSQLLAHASALGYLSTEAIEIEGVSFEGAEADGALSIVNGASLQMLDEDIGLDSRAAAAIVATRPFAELENAANLQALAELPYVGSSALSKLKNYVSNWSSCAQASTSVESVSFSSLSAHDSLDFVNQAPAELLSSISGIGTLLSQRIISYRPFENVEQIAEVPGIGAATLSNLVEQIGVRWCPVQGARCGCPAEASYRPPYVGFDENGLYYFLNYGERWQAERILDSGFLSHDGSQVINSGVEVQSDSDAWQDIATQLFPRLWDCCLQYQYQGAPLELGSNRHGVLHLGRIINAHDHKPYVMAYWQDVDDSSFAWIFEKDAQEQWVLRGEVYLN